MKRYLMPLGTLLLAGLASANDIGSLAQSVDSKARIPHAGNVVTVVTSARHITPHDLPSATIDPAWCDYAEVLVGQIGGAFEPHFESGGNRLMLVY